MIDNDAHVPLIVPPHRIKSLNYRVRQRQKRLMYNNTRTNNCINTINQLSRSAMTKPRNNVPILINNAKPLSTSTSTRIQQHISQSSVRYGRLLHGCADVTADNEPSIHHSSILAPVHIPAPSIISITWTWLYR
jgi:hypothetical protein